MRGFTITVSAIALTIAWSHRTAVDEGIVSATCRRRAAAPEPTLIVL